MKVTFKATRELTSLSCFATNKVMDDQQVKTSHLKLCLQARHWFTDGSPCRLQQGECEVQAGDRGEGPGHCLHRPR